MSDGKGQDPMSARRRLLVSLGFGLAASVAGAVVGPAESALIGVAVAGVVFVTVGWTVLSRLGWQATKSHVEREDFNPAADEVMVVGVALTSLGGIAAFLATSGSSADAWTGAVAVLGVAMAWASIHLMYATRYAHLYYGLADRQAHPIDFNQKDQKPTYRDFLYFSYNLGMTYQVSDTNVQAAEIRQVVLRHCLLSYVFGTAILATTINLVLGALTG